MRLTIVQCFMNQKGITRKNIEGPMYCGSFLYGEPWFLDVGGHVTKLEVD